MNSGKREAGSEKPAHACRVRAPVGALLAGAIWVSSPPPPQGPVVDRGSFTISRGAGVVGRETFTIRRGGATVPDGYTISTSASYPPTSPRVTLSPVVELGPDSLPVQVQFDVFGGAQERVYLQFGPHRVTLRMVHPGGERARELPAAGPEVLVDDSVFALYALLPRGAVSLRALAARTGRRSAAEIVDRGEERVAVQGVTQTLRHVVLRVGEQPRDLWYDAQGRLMRVDVPATGLVAERMPGPP